MMMMEMKKRVINIDGQYSVVHMEINYTHFGLNKGGKAERRERVFVSDCLTD